MSALSIPVLRKYAYCSSEIGTRLRLSHKQRARLARALQVASIQIFEEKQHDVGQILERGSQHQNKGSPDLLPL